MPMRQGENVTTRTNSEDRSIVRPLWQIQYVSHQIRILLLPSRRPTWKLTTTSISLSKDSINLRSRCLTIFPLEKVSTCLTVGHGADAHMASTTATIEENMWDTDNSWNSEHFLNNTMMQSEPSGLPQANLPTTYQTSTETASSHFAYAPGMEPRSQESSGPVFPARDNNKSLGLMVLSRSNSSQDPEIQLRSASRKSKNRKVGRPASSNSQAHARKCHNLVEKQYRTRLKAQFENLLTVLPTAQDPDYVGKDATGNPGRYLSRGQVLDAARERILKLENEAELSTLRCNRLLKDIARMERTLLEEKNRAALSFWSAY